MQVLILANGDSPSRETAEALALNHALILAVDGAVHKAKALALTPDVLTGDFDSVHIEEVCAIYPKMRVIATPNQEKSDLEKAIAVACDLGAESITVIGASGGRMDHTLANMAVLLTSRIPTCFVDDFGSLRAIRSGSDSVAITMDSVALSTNAGDTVSLVTFAFETYVSISGVAWPLVNSHLIPGTRGVSNVAVGTEVIVRAEAGSVFVAHLRKHSVDAHSALP